MNYKAILLQLQHQQDLNLTQNSRYQQLSAHKRGLVVQEDAQCAICNNGDYEDEDLIVFCGMCNIPVHQKCYGIDVVPENDWICNNCSCLALKRGLQVRCILCPKRGGAMKPTSVFSSYEHYQRYHIAAAKKKGLSSQVFLQIQKQESAQSCSKLSKSQLFEREDKNHALSQILTRECNFQDALIQQKRQAGEKFAQEVVEFHFLETEAMTESPEDYDFFLQRNHKLLQTGDVPPTETLYEWVHLSCAMWIPGPVVTPKTPVRLNKIDCKRFQLQCIICGMKNEGACIQCQHSKCMISFHIECARRANYFMEAERVDKERYYRIFCEKHRPLKIVKEQEERDRQAVEEVHKFARVIEKSLEINERVQAKIDRQKRQMPFSKINLKYAIQALPSARSNQLLTQQKRQQKLNMLREKELQKQQLLDQKRRCKLERENLARERELARKLEKQKCRKWRESDKVQLFERVKSRYLQMMKLRLNLIVIDPFSKQQKLKERDMKRQQSLQQAEQKRRLKKEQSKCNQQAPDHTTTTEREGLRKRTSTQAQLLQSSEAVKALECGLVGSNQAQEESEETKSAVYFKFGNPVYLQELDWAITLSKYEFPWLDIADGLFFTARECYEKYVSLVRDPHTFMKKVLNGGGVIREKYQKLMQNQLSQPPRFLISEPTQLDQAYCLCQGKNPSGFFVACEGENDCPYGGWLHPECTYDLVNLPRETIDNMGVWYCHACTDRMRQEELSAKENQMDNQDVPMDSDSGESFEMRRLEAEIEVEKLIIEDLEQDYQENQDEEMEDQMRSSRDDPLSEANKFCDF